MKPAEPMVQTANGPGWGPTVDPVEKRCGACGGAGFIGRQVSRDGVEGLRCMECGAIKPGR
jgi:hypothetical protein